MFLFFDFFNESYLVAEGGKMLPIIPLPEHNYFGYIQVHPPFI